MAKSYRLRAAKGMQLEEMGAEEIERYATDLADRALDLLPDGVRPTGVNRVVLESMRPGVDQEWGVWAEWTRACCDRRPRIEDFEEPVVQDLLPAGELVARERLGEHVESQLRVQKLENPAMHRRG